MDAKLSVITTKMDAKLSVTTKNNDAERTARNRDTLRLQPGLVDKNIVLVKKLEVRVLRPKTSN